MIKPAYISAFAVCALCTPLRSQDSLAELSFEDLMDVEVSVASKKNESIYDAPGIISSYDKNAVQLLGRYTLKELADITPGYSSSILYGEPGFETRGVKSGSFNNNRHLVLVDGIPVNHIRANKAPAGEELSLYGADRVEFLRGPASALYGTGAYYGVVNIIPQVPELKGTHFKSSAGLGTLNAYRTANLFSAHRGESQTFWASGSIVQQAASKSPVGEPASENYRNWDDLKAVSLQGSWKLSEGVMQGLGAGTYYLMRNTGLGEHWNGDFSHEINDLRWETFISFLRFDRSFSDLLKMNSYALVNRSTEIGTFTPLSASAYQEMNGTGELLYHYEVPIQGYQCYADLNYAGSAVDVTGGMSLDWRYQPGEDGGTLFYFVTADSGLPAYQKESQPSVRSDDFKTASAFLQVRGNVPLLDGMLITGGVRADHGEGGRDQYTQFSPRLALVQRFTRFLNMKVLYGTALHAPSIKEIKLNDEAKSRVPDLASTVPALEAGSFSTLEAGVVLHEKIKTENTLFAVKCEAAGFTNKSINEIMETKYSGFGKTENFFVNSNDTILSHGCEFEARGDAEFGLGIFGNYSFAKAHNRVDRAVPDIPIHKVNGGITFRSERTGIYSSLAGRYVREYSAVSGTNLPGYASADAVLGWKSPVKAGAEIKVLNILDEQVLFPVDGKALIPLKGRQVQFALTAEF